jgi:hypothetical protein
VNNKLYQSLFLGVGIAIVASTSYALIVPEKTEPSFDSNELPLPAIHSEASALVINSPTVALSQEKAKPEFNTATHEIKKGESLSVIFSKLNLSIKDLHSITHANELGKQFASIRPGKNLIVNSDFDGVLQQLIYQKNSIDTLEATRSDDDSFNIEIISKPIEKRIKNAQATINSSLFIDGKEAGLSDKTIMQLANIFAWDIDFALSRHKGDQLPWFMRTYLLMVKKLIQAILFLPNSLVSITLLPLSDLKTSKPMPAISPQKAKACVKPFYAHLLTLRASALVSI